MKFNVRFNDNFKSDEVIRIVNKRIKSVTSKFVLKSSISGESFINYSKTLTDSLIRSIKKVTNVNPSLSTSGGTSDARFICELCPVLEFGLVGNLFILGLYLALSFSILRISYLVQSRFSQLTCVGISMMLFFYVFVNVAMVSGMLPVVGAPLPLISYGGTSMLTVFIGLGIVTSILIHDRQEE